MADETRTNATAPVLESLGGGFWVAPGARIIDRTGRKMLPIGRDGFVPAAEGSVVIDKTMLMADVLDFRLYGDAFLPTPPLWQDAQHVYDEGVF